MTSVWWFFLVHLYTDIDKYSDYFLAKHVRLECIWRIDLDQKVEKTPMIIRLLNSNKLFSIGLST